MVTFIHGITNRYTRTLPLNHKTILSMIYSIMDRYTCTVPFTHTAILSMMYRIMDVYTRTIFTYSYNYVNFDTWYD